MEAAGLENLSGPGGGRFAVRHPEAHRGRARADLRTQGAAARRAGGRAEHARDRGAADLAAERCGARHHAAGGRARHAFRPEPLCEHVVVLNFGRKIFEGTPEAVHKDRPVLDRLSWRRCSRWGVRAVLLEVEGLDVRYGRNHAVKSMDLTVEEGEIVTVLGANGAGKSSLLKAVQGTVKATRPGKPALRRTSRSPAGSAPKRVRQRARHGARGPADIFVSADRAREPADGRLYSVATPYDQAEIDEIYQRFPNSGRAPRHAGPRCCRGASSRCWRSAGRCWPNRG